MESDAPPTSSSPVEAEKKKGFANLFRKHKDDHASSGGEEGEEGEVERMRLGEKLKQKKASRKEKKERREARKDMKKNPQFDFIEVNEPANVKKRDLKQKKKEDAAVFQFTEENKHLKGMPKVTRQMARAVKHAAGESSDKSGAGEKSGGEKSDKSGGNGGESGEKNGEAKQGKKMTRADLEEFVLRHPMHRLRGTTWNYLHILRPAAGSLAREKMVVLAGGGVRAELFFELLETLAEDFELVVLMMPRELATFEDYHAGLDLVRSGLGVPAPFHLFGIALGGAVALDYARAHPGRLRSLVLSHAAPPDAEFGKLGERYATKVADRNKQPDKKDSHVPSALSRALLGFQVRSKDLARDCPKVMMNTDGMLAFWKKQMHRFALDSGSIQSKLKALAKYHLETVYDEKSFADLKCPVLIVDTERSDAFGKRCFEVLRKLLPMAHAEIMEGYGVLALFVKGDEVANLVLKWLAKNYFEKTL